MLKLAGKYIDKFFRRFFLAYIVLLIISVVAFWILYHRSAAIIEAQSINHQTTALRQIRTRMDDNLAEIMTQSIFAANNLQVREIAQLCSPLSGPNVIVVREAMSMLRNFQTHNPILSDFFVVYGYSGIIITPHVGGSIDALYTNRIMFDDMPAAQWNELIFEYKNFSRFIPVMTSELLNQEVIQYITPFTSGAGHHGVVVSFINNRAITEMFWEAGISDMGAAFILSNGEIISAVTGNGRLFDLRIPTGGEGSLRILNDGYTYFVTYTTSRFLGWQYVSVVRSDYILAELDTFRSSVLLVALLVLAFTLVLSVVFSVHNTQPIKNLQKVISSHIPILQYSFFNDLFLGNYYDIDEAVSKMESLGIDLHGNRYVVAVVKQSRENDSMAVRYLQSLDKIPSAISTYIASNSGGGVKFHTISAQKDFIILFAQDSKDGDTLREYVHGLANWLDDKREISEVTIGIGGTVSQITDTHRSYAQAIEALQYYMVLDSAKVVCLYEDVPHRAEYYYYPEQEENRLMNMVKNGDTEGVRATLNAVCSENFTSRQLSNSMMVAFIGHLWQGVVEMGRLGLVMDEALEEKLNESLESFAKHNELERLQLCTQLYLEISESLRIHKQNKLNVYMAEIKQYVNDNFTDPDISLASVADNYNFSEAYLSGKFKEFTGENFYNYVQTLRINMVIQLLENPKLSIQEISERAGYSTYNTFAKAFKRVTGVTAGDYRKNR